MSSFSFLGRYVSHQLNAKTIYTIHSPFVYDFCLKVLKDSKGKDEFPEIEKVRKSLMKQEEFVRIIDLGAGTRNRGTKDSTRRVKDIARRALKPPYLARLLGRAAKTYKPNTILELGTSLGITTAYLALSSPISKIFTLEGIPSVAALARKNFQGLGLKQITLVEGNFTDTLPGLLRQIHPPRMIYIDGNHRYDPTIDYFHQFMKDAGEEDILIFDDIHWSAEMEKAWKYVQEQKEVFLTLDLFYFGFVFLKKNREKEHFKLRLF